MKKIRWFSSIFILVTTIIGNVIVSGYIWSFGNIETYLLSLVFYYFLMTLFSIGWNKELNLIDKNRSQHVLKMIGKVATSSLPQQIFHIQTIAKDIQIFVPPCNYHQNATNKVYYVFYPREQIVIKYIWDRKNKPVLNELLNIEK